MTGNRQGNCSTDILFNQFNRITMKLVTILKDSLNVKESEINDEARLADFGEWDSMTHMFFITKLEEAYSIELTGDEIADMRTVGDVRRILINKGKEA
jgi:acyl carrier protein